MDWMVTRDSRTMCQTHASFPTHGAVPALSPIPGGTQGGPARAPGTIRIARQPAAVCAADSRRKPASV